MKLGSETGSVVNHLMARGGQPVPAVGMAATILGWSDRHAATVVKVTPTQVHVQQDRATRVDGNGLSESQTYTYQPDPDAPVRVFRRTKSGWRETGGGAGLLLGERREYIDPTF